MENRSAFDTDVLIVGSGFGGSVMALRLAEAGLRVHVLEQGGPVGAAEMSAADQSVRRFLWSPQARLFGYFAQHVFRHVSIVGGVGIGGGSIVYGAVLLRPPSEVFEHPGWRGLRVDFDNELRPHFETAERMLGVARNPYKSTMDRWLEQAAAAMHAGHTYGPTHNGIYFGKPDVSAQDPYFAGAGPDRVGCNLCGRCIAGCPTGAKNSLDKNYLFLAQGHGAQVLPWHAARKIESIDGGYLVSSVDPRSSQARPPISAERVVVAAGVVGSLDLLFRCRDVHLTLPKLSPRLGKQVRTNSEAIVGVHHRAPPPDLTTGTAISSHFYPDAQTHITQNRFPPAYRFMRALATPLAEGPSFVNRLGKTALRVAGAPQDALAHVLDRDWHRHITVLTVMQHSDSELEFAWRKSPLPGRGGLHTRLDRGQRSPPAHLPVASRAARVIANQTGDRAFDFAPAALANVATTAHILGGCVMGRDGRRGVINADHEVHGYPGLYVVDGAAVSSNIGVNPSLTITAMAERAATRLVGRLP